VDGIDVAVMVNECDTRRRGHVTTTNLSRGVAIDALTFLLPTIIMNANTAIGTNDTNNNNNMNTTGLNPTGNDLLQAISGGGLPALQVVAASGDTFPPLKAAVIEALAIIGIIKVCVLTSIILSHLSM